MKAGEIRLAPVTEANRALVASLQLAPEQMDFVASNADSLREAGSDDDARAARRHACLWAPHSFFFSLQLCLLLIVTTS
ncbi:hypothetical protein ACFSQT_07515 [Mesorhizobium calcicola]|uniref:Uncharacterized protein n=1 Tax=Mesorhizobium calcicola TaxID=1300310 RepID=A0ABW4WC07_9HYPH